MNDNRNNKSAAARRIKYFAGAIATAAVYIALLASLLIESTTARYAETRTFLTDFDIASFNTVLRGAGEDDTDAVATAAMNNSSLMAFAKEFDAEDFLPGEVRKLPFTVTNGTTEDNMSEVPVEYSIKLRVTKSLPLNFTLSYTETTAEIDETTGNKVEKTTTYLPGTPVQVTPSGYKEGDVKWYEYSFYEIKKDESGTVINDDYGNPVADTDKEAKFTLEAGDLDLNLHAINITWPIKAAGTETVIIDGENSTIQKLKSNDTDYMKEVEMLEVIVSSVSANPTAENGPTTSITVNESNVNDNVNNNVNYYSPGILYIIDGNTYKISADTLDTVHHYSYEIDYRAFNRSSEDKPYSFSMTLEDGVEEIENPTEAIRQLYPKYSYYTLRMRVPVAELNYDAQSGTGSYSNEDYSYFIKLTTKDGTVNLTRLQSTYYLYHVSEDYPSVVENAERLKGISSDSEALKYWKEKLKDDERAESYIYRLDVYTSLRSSTPEYEYVNRNTISKVDALVGGESVYNISGNDDSVVISIYDIDGNKAVDISSICDNGANEIFSVDHKLYIDVDVVYSNAETTSLLPAALKQ